MQRFTVLAYCYAMISLVAYIYADPQFLRGPAYRSSVGDTLKPFSVKQVKDTKWKPRTVSTTTVYAASFLKHNRPMPEPLRIAWDSLQSRGKAGLTSRVNGQTITTSDGL